MTSKKYKCNYCDTSYYYFIDAQNCCIPKEIWCCDECFNEYNEKESADMCCFSKD